MRWNGARQKPSIKILEHAIYLAAKGLKWPPYLRSPNNYRSAIAARFVGGVMQSSDFEEPDPNSNMLGQADMTMVSSKLDVKSSRFLRHSPPFADRI
jgi:hypothetical protein